jgi:GNAT superfamily N-acetyltransferase
VNIRPATRADEPALRALEARTPLNIDGTPIATLHDNFFEVHELQNRKVVMLAELDGDIAGVCAGALHRAPLAGQERLLLYMHHERIAPEHQRKGLGGALTRAVSDYWKANEADHIDSSYWYIAEGNQQSRNFAERSGNKPWPVSMSYFGLNHTAASGERPQRIGAGPIFDIVRLINRTHDGKDLFRPYEQVDFGERLSRCTSYGWGDIYGRHRDGRLVAVAGLWRDTVADYGYEAGAEEDMVALIRSLVPPTSAPGHEGLTLFPDTRSPLFERLAALPHFSFEALFYAPRIEPRPENPSLYVDPAYF